MSGRLQLNLALALLLGTLIGLHWLVLPDPSRRNYEFLPDMVESYALDAQAPAPALDDGTPLDLRPPAGSVVQGFLPLLYAATPEGALRAGEELQAPDWEDDAAAISRGAFVFNTHCSVCHGAAGRGDGTVTKRGVPPPPSFMADNAVNMSDGRMYHVISLGQGNMAPYASHVPREDRWKVIRFIRTLQEAEVAEDTP
jgi:mono/diheme cytochrome c family protein